MPSNGNSPGSSTRLFPVLAQVSDLWKRQESRHAPGLGLLGGAGVGRTRVVGRRACGPRAGWLLSGILRYSWVMVDKQIHFYLRLSTALRPPKTAWASKVEGRDGGETWQVQSALGVSAGLTVLWHSG